MAELEQVLRELKEELAKQRRERRGGGGGTGDGGGTGGGGSPSRRRDFNFKGEPGREIMTPVSKEQFDPTKQMERLIVEGKRFEDLNRSIFQAGGANIREMYGEMGRAGRTVFDEIGESSRKYFGSTKAGLDTMLTSFKNIGQMEIITNEQRKSIVMTGTALDQLGMPAHTTTGIIDTLTRGFGRSVEESASMAKGVYDLAASLQLPPRQVAEEFRRAQKDMSYSGDKIGQVFTGLQRQSRITGISYGDLMSAVGESMDTFEGAASRAGSLNSVLGGPYLNSMELLTASEDQRIEMLQDAFAESGKNVDELGKYELKALAKQLGMSPENARRLLRGDATREELTKKIDERMETAGTAGDIRMQDADEGMKELRGRFDSMIPPMSKLAIQFDNLGEKILRLTPGLEDQELYRIRDAAAARILGDEKEVSLIKQIEKALNIPEPQVASISALVDKIGDLLKRTEDEAPKPISFDPATPAVPAAPTVPKVSPTTTASPSGAPIVPSDGEKLPPADFSKSIAAAFAGAFRSALSDQPVSVKINLNSRNISDFQGLLMPNPTGDQSK